ncbi:hypothetical protein CO038_04640 [Candidatus Pacearchaeota archaeon CG_4_9_14_0_2_um_filter_39_13]|nr:glycosyltransferase [Candidatus Pacearchaeota archaeon]OIO44467.1 MAG: hypothetical protein AUJ64_00010 [Candidatus Pacearchaeota archaeon CG1_02_39_14]PJC44244.1 MAG: hypothetical protein CO038_04640 [Candidatus Pacearchaeota archaeon CG_4_9_14_0_2_um_filter_39_13]
MKVSIVIPARNEERRIGRTLSEYSEYLEKAKKDGIDYEILVMVNNTTDNTREIIKEVMRKNKRIGYIDLPGRGKRYAILEGFKESLNRKNEFIGFVDADMATPPESFYELIKGIGEHDASIASRAHPKSVVNTSWKRKIFSKGFNFGVRSTLQMPYKDTQCGAKLFRREAVENILRNPPYSQWAFDVEILYNLRKAGFRIKEIPTIWNDQADSTLSLKKVPIQMFFSVIRLNLLRSPLKHLVRLYDKMPERVKIHHAG